MPTQQKIDRIQDIKARLERSTIVMTTSYSGIPVNEMVELRRAMRSGGVDFTIVKNTLLALAADAAQKPQLKEIVQGPTAIALGYDDPVDAARAVADYIRTGRSSLALLGAVMGDESPMTPGEVTRLASLPPKAQLLAMLLGQMQSPIARLLSILNGPLQGLDNVLQARVRQLEAEAQAPAPTPDPEPEPETAAEPDAPEAIVEPEESPVDAEPAVEAEEASAEEPTAEAEDAPPDEPEAEGESEPEPAAEDAPPEEAEAGPEPEPAAEDAPAEEPEPETDAETAGDDKPE